MPSLSTEIVQFIEELQITQGERAGQPFKILPWQRQFIRGAFKSGIHTASLSIARGNGKSTLTSAIALARLLGPSAEPESEIIIVASSWGQGGICFRHCLSWLPRDRAGLRVLNSTQQASITNRANGARLRVMASDPRRLHGIAPSLILMDEPAQWPPQLSDRMYSALRTSSGKISDCRIIALGTRSADQDHWFSRLLEGNQSGVYAQSHHAPRDADIGDRKAWEIANPSMKHIRTLRRAIEIEAEGAKQDSNLIPSFRALRLNLGISDITESFVLEADTWQRIESDQAERQGAYCLGIDVGSTNMTGASAYWPQTGRLEVFGCFPETPNLHKRAEADGVGDRYQIMLERKELVLYGPGAVDLEKFLNEIIDRWGKPAVMVCDRYKEGELSLNMARAKFPICPLEIRGQGFKDGSEDLNNFRRACLSGKVKPVPSLILRTAMSEARSVCDPSGNEKLAKATQGGRRHRHRDDVVASSILAVSSGMRMEEVLKPRRLEEVICFPEGV